MSFKKKEGLKIERKKLTDEQIKVVLSNSKTILCKSCPGSGKTTTLVSRAQRISDDLGHRNLICTFSNKASKDVLQKIPEQYADLIDVLTIHALALRMIKTGWDKFSSFYGAPKGMKGPIPMTEEDELYELDSLISARFGSQSEGKTRKLYEAMCHYRKIGLPCSSVRTAMNAGQSLGVEHQLSYSELDCWSDYERRIFSQGKIPFDYMCHIASNLMVYPEVYEKVIREYQHLLIDEAQDTSTDQWKLLVPLIDKCLTTLVVYDPNQAIYGWRGNDSIFLQQLGNNDQSVHYTLTKSFRTSTEVSDFANKIVPDGKTMIDSQGHSGTVTKKVFPARVDEVKWVLENILRQCNSGVKHEDVVILSRTNRYLELFEFVLLKNNIPYQGQSFYAQEHIKELLDFLLEYKNVKWEYLVERSFLQSQAYSQNQKLDFQSCVQLIKNEGLQTFQEMVYKAWSNAGAKKGIFLMTGHKSKGLEWSNVYVVGTHDGHVPHKLANNLMEEKDLFYVMCSRAKDNLFLTAIEALSSLVV